MNSMFRYFKFKNGAEYNSCENTIEKAHEDALNISRIMGTSIDPVATSEARIRLGLAKQRRGQG